MDFFAELEQLQLKTPRLSLLQLQVVNSEYTVNTDRLKNCFLLSNAVGNEDCMYGRDFYGDTDCVDCDHIFGSQLCYQCLNCKNCYNCNELQDSENCRDCNYGYDLKGCADCIGCAGLRKRQYYIFNQPYSKEEYLAKKKSLTEAEIREEFEKVKLASPRVYAYQVSSENFTGNYVDHCQNVFEAYDVSECQDVAYMIESKKCHNSYDISILEEAGFCYEISAGHIMQNSNYCFLCASCSDLEYCELMFNCQNCFGCIGLNKKKYYILNQPYEKDEYFRKVAEIKADLRAKGEYGRRFLPSTYLAEDTVAVWERM